MTSHEYETHLASVAWQATRGAVLVRERGRCRRCKRKRATSVHHWTYKRLGRESLNDLAGFCRSCHDAVEVAESGQLALPIHVADRNYLGRRLPHPQAKELAEVQYVDGALAALDRWRAHAEADRRAAGVIRSTTS